MLEIYIVAIRRLKAELISLRLGRSFRIYRDSSIRRSELFLWLSIISKSWRDTSPLHCSLWRRIEEWLGFCRGWLVLGLKPRCSAARIRSVRQVEPTYTDPQLCGQQYLYITDERMVFGRESLKLKNEPMRKFLVRTKLGTIWQKYWEIRFISSI